jgi:hypothetical protein
MFASVRCAISARKAVFFFGPQRRKTVFVQNSVPGGMIDGSTSGNRLSF